MGKGDMGKGGNMRKEGILEKGGIWGKGEYEERGKVRSKKWDKTNRQATGSRRSRKSCSYRRTCTQIGYSFNFHSFATFCPILYDFLSCSLDHYLHFLSLHRICYFLPSKLTFLPSVFSFCMTSSMSVYSFSQP